MPLTLAQYAQQEKSMLRTGIYYGLAVESNCWDLCPIRTINGLEETGVRYDDVPIPGYVALDGTISEATVDGHQITHTVSQLLHHIDVPTVLDDVTGDLLTKPSAQQIKLAMKGAAYKASDMFFNGDKATDPNGFDGLKKLVSNMDSEQTLTTGLNIQSFDAGDGHTLADMLNDLFYAISGHKPDAVFASSRALLKMESALRRDGLLGQDYNWKAAMLEIGDPRASMGTASTKPHFVWRGVPFYDPGPSDGKRTSILPNTAGVTDVYAVKFGEDELEGLQAQALDVIPIGRLEPKENYRWRPKWVHGLAVWGPRSIAYYSGLTI